MQPKLLLIGFAAPWGPMIIIIINRAPVIPRDWSKAATTTAAAPILFRRASVIPILRAISIINRASALYPWTPTVLRSIGLPAIPWGWAASLLWTSFIWRWTALPPFRWQW